MTNPTQILDDIIAAGDRAMERPWRKDQQFEPILLTARKGKSDHVIAASEWFNDEDFDYIVLAVNNADRMARALKRLRCPLHADLFFDSVCTPCRVWREIESILLGDDGGAW